MAIVESLVSTLRRFLDFICFVYGSCFQSSKKGALPPLEDSLILKPAVQIADEIRQGKLKVVDVVEAYLKRIQEVNGFVNAVVAVRVDAVKDAKELDDRIELELKGFTSGDHESVLNLPLLGIPFCCKETVGVKGMPFTAGLVLRKGELAPEDAPVIKNLKKAGAIPIAVTNVPELQYWWSADNKLYGRTNNPYDLSRIAGGSSGGEGAIISSTGAVIGVGTDIGGSLRIPAFCCGIFGHHTSPSVFPAEGMVPIIKRGALTERMFSFGPMCRFARDLKPMLKAMAGDYLSKLPKIDHPVDFSKLKIYYMLEDRDPLKTPVTEEFKTGILKIVAHFESTYGTRVQYANFENMKKGFMMLIATFKEANAPRLASVYNNGEDIGNIWWEIFKAMVGYSDHMMGTLLMATAEKYAPDADSDFVKNFTTMRDQLREEFFSTLGDDGVFIYPSQPEVAPKHGTTVLKAPSVGYTSIFNVLSATVTQCPVGLNSDGIPVGVQVVAKQFNDHLPLAVALEIEKIFGGWVPPCAVNC